MSRGFNTNKTHARMIREHGYMGGTHAECDALMRASKGDVLIVVRLHKSGKLSCSKPCKRCLKMAKEFGIKRIFFTDWDSSIQEIKL
jgi:deoxycytidylate deaminase